MLCCIVDSNPYQVSCPGSSVGRSSARLDCRVSWVQIPPPRAARYFSLEKRAVLGVVDLFAVPLPFYLIVFTCIMYVKGTEYIYQAQDQEQGAD